ncbi:MAG: preprotein translocase subunit YajC [Planctomycetota bacterium]
MIQSVLLSLLFGLIPAAFAADAAAPATPPAAAAPAPSASSATPAAATATSAGKATGSSSTAGTPGTSGTPATPGTTASTVPANGQAEPSTMSGLTSMLPIFAVMIFIFYFMLIRPESKRRKEHEALLSTIKKGSHVITSHGVHGVVQDVQGDTVLLTIDQNNKVTIKIQKSHIGTVTAGGDGK